MKLRSIFVLLTAKTIVRLTFMASRCFNFGAGSNIPGKLVVKLFPNIMQLLIPRFKKGWVLITGTNGKTTTTKILVELLQKDGYTVCTNARGANLLTGIVTSILLAEVKPLQEFMADYAVFEIDEAVLFKSFKLLRPVVLVVTNFSRDQLDRYGEVDSNVSRIMELLRNNTDPCRVVINGNDPNISRIGLVVKPEDRIYFGLREEIASPEAGLLAEQEAGAPTGEKIAPKLDVWADQIQTAYLSGSSFRMGVAGNGAPFAINIQLPGVFNILNALAASAVGQALGVDLQTIKKVLSEVRSSYGRSESFNYHGFAVFMFLVKNPVGFNHVIQLLSQANGERRVLLLLNDLAADGRDVSWIWDVALENLWKVPGIKEIVASGTRAGDMALRIKYSNPPDLPLVVDYSPKRAFRQLTKQLQSGEEILILANYTAMITFRPFLARVSSKS
ncbi:MAG: MurT ligase domain-containing protein [Bacillota bacterium]